MEEKPEGLFEFEYDELNGITAKCRQCDWNAEGKVKFETESGQISSGG